MGGYYGLAVLMGVAFLLMTGQCDVNCRGTDGHKGQAGISGRDGRPGAKGEKGEPAVMADGPVDAAVLLRLKGDTGSRGKQGVMGPKGYRGDLGAVGGLGTPGRPGADGKRIGLEENSPQLASAFSVMRTDSSYPAYGRVTYGTSVVNAGGDFNTATGYFTCRVPGYYYFTFHSMAKVSVCLRIASDTTFRQPGFCDYNRNSDQVLSGGVVLQLIAEQKVWLESFSDRQTPTEVKDNNDKLIIFSGFLLFSNSD